MSEDLEGVPSIRTEKRSNKRGKEVTIVHSDRDMLVSAANELVSYLSVKQIAPLLNSGIGSQIDLSSKEQQAYDSALDYLSRQFEVGHKDAETVVTKKESERTEENRIE